MRNFLNEIFLVSFFFSEIVVTVVNKQKSSGSSDKNAITKFNVNVLPETYIPSYITVAIVGTVVTVLTVVTIFSCPEQL